MKATFNKGDKLDHFVIVGHIADGGMGTVYQAYEPTLERTVAIKVLHAEFANDPQYQEEFLDEARNVASLRHTNIVPLYFVGETSKGIKYFAMAYIEGQNLEEWADNGRTLDGSWAAWFMRQAIAALDYASRAANVIHLDVKPSNFLVDAEHIVMLTDFGLAMKQNYVDSEDETRELLGTPSYCSPEHVLQRKPDIRTDIYCLGASLFHLMTGDTPFPRETVEQICRAAVLDPFPAERALDCGVSQGWVSIMRKMMEKKPEHRFQDYASLLEAVRKADSFRYGASLASLPEIERMRALPRKCDAIDTLFGILPSGMSTDEADRFKVRRTYSMDETLETLDRRFELLRINVISGQLKDLCQPAAGNLVDLVRFMDDSPSFGRSILELTAFFQRFTDEPIDDEVAGVELIGLERARNLGLTNLILQSDWQGKRPLNWTGFWQHAITTGLFAEMMGDMLELSEHRLAYVTGLLHGVGKLVFAEMFPTTYLGVILEALRTDSPLIDAELEVFGIDNAQLGEAWLGKMRVPKALCRTILAIPDPEGIGEETQSTASLTSFMNGGGARVHVGLLANLVNSASTLARIHGIGFNADSWLEQCPWRELKSTREIWNARSEQCETEWEDFVDFFENSCKSFPDLTMAKMAQPPVKDAPAQ